MSVPVTVRKVKTDDEIDELRIIENINRRTIQPYEYALNIARLIQISKADGETTGRSPLSPIMSEVAKKLGVTEQKVHRNKTISNLIPQLGQLLNDKIISQFAAYQLGQDDERARRPFYLISVTLIDIENGRRETSLLLDRAITGSCSNRA